MSNLPIFWQRLHATQLTIDQAGSPLQIDPDEVRDFYLPLAERLLSHSTAGSRLVVGIAGPPGSGKSTFAAILAAVINSLHETKVAVVVGQDGWHYPNAYLETHTTSIREDEILLRKIKGMPQTFDVTALRDFLARLKSQPEASFPVYSRAVHDPLTDAGTINANHKIILVEGNYLLLQRPGWIDLRACFDLTIFLSTSQDVLLDGLRRRHLLGGKNPQSIESHLLTVDLPNFHLVTSESASADIQVVLRNNRQIDRIFSTAVS
jgi:pantothenate kinase